MHNESHPSKKPQYYSQENINENIEDIIHEFQLRLQALLADSEILKSGIEELQQAPSELVDTSSEILYGVMRLSVLVQNLAIGLGEYYFEPQDLMDIVRESIALYSNEAKRKGLKIVLSSSDKLIADVSRIHVFLVFNNLISNAIKYSYRGTNTTKREVRVTGAKRKNYCEIAISNYGVGIRSEEFEHIFRKYSRGQMSCEMGRTGTGLGLWVSNGIVKDHGGRIGITSTRVNDAYITTVAVLFPIRRNT
jgi:signal transduction histidine kinase